MNKNIPVATPIIGEEEKEYVTRALEKGEVSGAFGEYISQFEEGFSSYVDSAEGIATTSGTSALHLAIASLGIGEGDEVLVSSLTNMASFFSVIYTVDIEPDTWNINPECIEKKITKKTRAIMVVHIYGHPVDMDPVLKIAKKHNLLVVEDAAEAHGAEYKGRKCGSLGDVGCFSFYANKIITTGEGGMVTTSNKRIADKARSLGSLAYGGEQRFMHKAVGFNYRMTNLQAALGLGQLKRIDEVVEKKRNIAKRYQKEFSSTKELKLPVEKEYAKNVYWMYHVVLQGVWRGRRKEVMEALREKGIETRESFVPYSAQEHIVPKKIKKAHQCPVAEEVGENGLYLPSGPALTDEEIKYVADNVKSILKK